VPASAKKKELDRPAGGFDMAIRNADIAAKFEEIADLLEIEAANPFRVRAYRNAARTLRGLRREAAAMLADGEDLSELPGIGKDLAGKIGEIVDTGSVALLDKLHKELPASLPALLDVPGLGPKRVKVLHETLGIETPEALAAAAKAGKLRRLAGFGAKTEARIFAALTAHESAARRFGLAEVTGLAETLVEHLRGAPGIGRVAVAGSYRRRRDTVGDLDILAIAAKAAPVMARFVAFDGIERVVSQGPTRSTVMLRGGLQVDLRVVAKESYGAALYYFTGSKAHNIAVRRLGQARGLKINEYGVFRGERRIAGETEESVFGAVGLPYIEPELREDRGEIEAARVGKLPRLVEAKDLKGDLHCHTMAGDGRDSLVEMAEAARERGLEYLAITEQSRRLGMAHGLDVKRLRRQMAEIDKLNGRLKGFTVLKGIEVDIPEDGRLDLPDEVLSDLDLVVGAVHGKFDLPRDKQTERLLRAMDHPGFTILAHPGGRLIGQREAMEIDMERVVEAAAARGCFLELNAQPERLDLTDIHCQMAKAAGVLVAISSDAHRSEDFDRLGFGIGQARRGWLGKADVLNSRSLAKLRPLLARTMRR
jgi:DNA polymerase (family 10)